MFEKLVRASLTHRVWVLIGLLMLSLSTFVLLPKLKLDAFPEVTNVQVTVNTQAPGLAAQEVEQLITYPIEAVMYALPHVEQVRSVSKTGLSGVTVVFNEGTDIYFARQLVFERLQSAKEMIPEGVGMPEMGPNTSGLGQVFQYLLVAEPEAGVDTLALRSLNDYLVKLLLMPVDGITDVLSFGGAVKQYQVNIDPNRLLSYRLSQQDVLQALERNHINAGGWYLNRGPEQLVIRGTGWLSSGQTGLAELRQVPLRTVEGSVIRLADVAKVAIGSEIRQGAVTMSSRSHAGEPIHRGEVVTGIVLKRIGANTNTTIEGIKARVSAINQALPDGVKLVPFYDQTLLIDQAIETVVSALLLAFLFICVVLSLFLMNLGATLLVLLSIPIAIGLALLLMAMLGISANLMSLGGLAVAIGMLVDGSVVMVERILKHQQHHAVTGEGMEAAIIAASRDVARPVFFAGLVILVVFAPLFSFEGVEAKLFQPMAVSIILAVIAAIWVALVVVPALAVYLLKSKNKSRKPSWFEGVESNYRKLLVWLLPRSNELAAISLSLFALSLYILSKVGTEFVPELEEGTLNLRVTLAPSASLETALAVAPVLERKLMMFPEVEYALSRIGRPEVGGDPEPVNNIEIYIGLKPSSEWTSANDRADLQAKMTEVLEEHPGLLFNFSQPIATRVDELLSGVKAQLAIKLFGPDLDLLASLGQQIEEQVSAISGTTDVALEQSTGEAQLLIEPNRQALSRYGLSVADVMALVQQGIGGTAAGQIVDGNERSDIYVRLAQEYRQSPAAIESLTLQSPGGAWVRLAEVARVRIESGPPQIRRDDVQRRVVIQANVSGRDMGSVVSDIEQAIAANLTFPPGYSVQIGGQYESQQRAQQRLMIVVPVSLLLIAGLLYLTFGNLGQTLLIMLNVPLATIGGVLSLSYSGQFLSVPSSVGFITLFGLAVLNGVVMVESINRKLDAAATVTSAILDGATTRLRPVLMTAMTSMLGLLPMLFSNGVGAEIQQPLAVVIVGGLATATLLTLLVLPCLYARFSNRKLTAIGTANGE